jgi:hypothetical protein
VPVAETRSALGVLKGAQFGLIQIVNDDSDYRKILSLNVGRKCFHSKTFYFTDKDTNRNEWPELFKLVAEPSDTRGLRKREYDLGHARAYILIVKSQTSPKDAFVSVRYRGDWYYISSDDDTSKENFALLGQIVTIQSIPSQSPPLTASINVGGR